MFVSTLRRVGQTSFSYSLPLFRHVRRATWWPCVETSVSQWPMPAISYLLDLLMMRVVVCVYPESGHVLLDMPTLLTVSRWQAFIPQPHMTWQSHPSLNNIVLLGNLWKACVMRQPTSFGGVESLADRLSDSGSELYLWQWWRYVWLYIMGNTGWPSPSP